MDPVLKAFNHPLLDLEKEDLPIRFDHLDLARFQRRDQGCVVVQDLKGTLCSGQANQLDVA